MKNPPHITQDRITRYQNNEPLKLIAHDHNITIQALLNTITRHAPHLLGRPRGGGPRAWPPA